MLNSITNVCNREFTRINWSPSNALNWFPSWYYWALFLLVAGRWRCCLTLPSWATYQAWAPPSHGNGAECLCYPRNPLPGTNAIDKPFVFLLVLSFGFKIGSPLNILSAGMFSSKFFLRFPCRDLILMWLILKVKNVP